MTFGFGFFQLRSTNLDLLKIIFLYTKGKTNALELCIKKFIIKSSFVAWFPDKGSKFQHALSHLF